MSFTFRELQNMSADERRYRSREIAIDGRDIGDVLDEFFEERGEVLKSPFK